jgi:hypothetical protein
VKFALVHSPLTGPDVWEPVATQLRGRGHEVVVPDLGDDGDAPYWRAHADSAAAQIGPAPVALVFHSNAGLLAAELGARIGVERYVFVDALLPRGGPRMDGDLAAALAPLLAGGGRWPDWTDADLREAVPDETRRTALVAGLRPRGADFFEEELPAPPPEWPEAPAAYLLLQRAPYAVLADEARRRGWAVRELEAAHFHMLVEPAAVADEILRLV